MRLAPTTLMMALFAASCAPKAAPPPTPEPPPPVELEVRQLPPQLVVTRTLTNGYAGLPDGITEGQRAAVEQGWQPAGPVMVVFAQPGRLELAFPVGGTPSVEAPWQVKNLPETKAAVMPFEGPYADSVAVNDELLARATAAGWKQNGPVFHLLLDDPKSVATNDLRIEVVLPVAR